MKAIVREVYGLPEVLELREVDPPPIGHRDVLIRVHAASVNKADWHLMTGKPYLVRFVLGGLRRPKKKGLGLDVAGRIEEVGRDVRRLRPGDEVFGEVSGAFAEYVRAGEDDVVLKPVSATFEEAAALPVAGLTALQGLRDKGKLKAGQRVLINGAAGGVGTFAVQIAKSFGAEVTGVCSTSNLDLVRSIGADEVVDYAREDYTLTDRPYDMLFDAVGNRPLSETTRSLGPGGVVVAVAGGEMGNWIGPLVWMIRMALASRFGRYEVAQFITQSNRADLDALGDLLGRGEIRPVIERRYELGGVAEALRVQGSGHARGKSVIAIAE